MCQIANALAAGNLATAAPLRSRLSEEEVCEARSGLCGNSAATLGDA